MGRSRLSFTAASGSGGTPGAHGLGSEPFN